MHQHPEGAVMPPCHQVKLTAILNDIQQGVLPRLVSESDDPPNF
jgi:hypothetical protein